MNDQAQSPIPLEWRAVADETAKYLSVARAIERKQYPDNDAPAGLLPALVIASALARASAVICNRFASAAGFSSDGSSGVTK